MRWYIGQKVICVESHRSGKVLRGKIYVINGMRTCKCNGIDLDVGVGISRGYAGTICTCGHIEYSTIGWLSERSFAPLQDESELSELTVEEILNKTVTA